MVNEYTIKNSSGKGGSRGGTPGDYVTRYMARNGATETLTPVRATEQEDYVQRYMARASAVERMDDVNDVQPEFRKIQKYGGVAFSRDSTSLSDEKLDAISHDIQSQFDKGKTVMKTVISFDPEYLKATGIVDGDFECENAGDYRGNIDQMKLRMGIQSGMERLGRGFDDLEYVGVIQVDTQHVHCHLAMVDKGRGRVMPDGTQKGKLSAQDMMQIRRGIDMYLDDEKEIQHMASNVDYDKRNTKCYIKQVSHRLMEENGMGQFLVQCLPEDKRLWRASSHDEQMKKANNMLRGYVREVFQEPDSGYDAVRKDIYAYAEARRSKEDLSGEEFRRLIKQGERRVEDECINSVYATLSGIEKSDRKIRTPMLEEMARPSEEVSVDAGEFEEFGYRLKSYGSRLKYHRDQKRQASEQVENYKKAESEGQTSEESRAILRFFEFEKQYQEQCMCKYQHFLRFLPPEDEYEDELEELLEYRAKTQRMQEMYDDRSLRQMKDQEFAEEYGRRVYQQHGGRYMTFAPDVIQDRLLQMQERLRQRDEKFADRLTDYGLKMTEDDDGNRSFEPEIKWDFEDVKHLDMHHMGYDSPHDMRVAKPYIDKYRKVADERMRLARDAMEYLYGTGQESEADVIPWDDVVGMYKEAHMVEDSGVIQSLRSKYSHQAQMRNKTVRLDMSLNIDENIRQRLREQQLADAEDNDYPGRRRR